MTMAASNIANGNDSKDKDVPLLSPPPLEPEESPEYSPYWSFLTPRRPNNIHEHMSPAAASNIYNERHFSTLAVAWNKGIAFCKIPILVVIVFGIWPFGILSFRRFQNSTDSTFHPIPGSPSALAQDAFAQNYASNDWMNPMHPSLLLVLTTDTNSSFTTPESPLFAPARDFCSNLTSYLNKTCWNETFTTTTTTTTATSSCNKYGDKWLKVTSYYSLQQEDLHWLSKTLATPNGDTVLLSIQYLLPPNATNTRFQVHDLMNTVQQYGHFYKPENCTISYTGIKWFQSDLMAATKTDLKRMDALVLPLALFLVGVVLPKARSSVVWIIPLITIITTVCCWSIVMSVLSTRIQITQFTPSIMTSLTLGMGIDYTLFLLSRYLERKHMVHMLHYGGQVLLLSGWTLMCTFLGFVCLPLEMLKSVGIGAAVAIGSCLAVNLTVVPALLHTRLGTWIVQTNDTIEDTTDESFLQRRPIADNDQEECPFGVVPHDSIWYRLSQHLLHPYKSIILFLLLVQLMIPVALYATQLKSSLSFDLMLPKTSPSLVTYHDLGRKLGYGRTSPYRILFDGRNAETRMDSEQGFDVMHRVLDELSAIDKEGDGGITHVSTGMQEFEEQKRTLMEALGFTPPKDGNATVLCEPEVRQQTTNYAGIAVLKNVYVPHSLFVAAKYCAQVKPHCPVEILHLVDYVDEMSTSEDRFATFVTATLAVNPFSDEGVQWLESARETIQRLQDGNALGGIQVCIEGSAAIEYDAVKAVYGAFPKVITITVLVVFVLFGIFFKSIVAPLRSIVSIAMTLCFVFGLCVLVYQHGILNWTRVPSWTSTGDEISWLVPVMAFSIIVGLALDYDVFLISRILEYRQEGQDHESSIVAGLYSTGGIITAAGLIMAVAFGGLMFSSSPVLYQWSFLLTSAVLLDTFVIRTLVVPIVLGWTGKFSWWPRRLPEILVVETANSDDSRLSLGPLSASHQRTSRGNEQLTQALLSP